MDDCKGTHPGTATFAVQPATGRFLLMKRAKPGAGAGTWSVPGGRVERGETWQAAAERELLEETCLTVMETVLLAVTTTVSGPEEGWLTVWNTGRCEKKQVLLNEEGSDYEWVTCGELWKFELWKPHWTPLLDHFQGTGGLEKALKGPWS